MSFAIGRGKFPVRTSPGLGDLVSLTKLTFWDIGPLYIANTAIHAGVGPYSLPPVFTGTALWIRNEGEK